MKAKITKNRRRGIKVVYISNPMRVTTTAASFRALVQQLTGADSTVAADMANSASSFVDVDDNGVVHGHPPPPAADSSFHSVVGQPMLLSDQMWSGTAPAVEEETPWEVYYGSLRRWILDD